jgi:hypothetical protein
MLGGDLGEELVDLVAVIAPQPDEEVPAFDVLGVHVCSCCGVK